MDISSILNALKEERDRVTDALSVLEGGLGRSRGRGLAYGRQRGAGGDFHLQSEKGFRALQGAMGCRKKRVRKTGCRLALEHLNLLVMSLSALGWSGILIIHTFSATVLGP